METTVNVARALPRKHMAFVASLEPAYLRHDDPIRQSGFGGGAERWRREREPILDAIDGDGDLVDIGCANGHLAACLVAWGCERGITLEPYGVDIGARLIKLARTRFPGREAHFVVANAWDWEPERRFSFGYMLYDCLPLTHLAEGIERICTRIIAPRGRLIFGAYGSRSDRMPPFDIAWWLRLNGYAVAGESFGGDPPVTRFAWIGNRR